GTACRRRGRATRRRASGRRSGSRWSGCGSRGGGAASPCWRAAARLDFWSLLGASSGRRGAGMMAGTSAGERRAAADGAQVAAERDREGKLVVRLAGTWTLEDGMPDLGAVEQALAERPPPASLAFDKQELHHWDSGVLAFVAKVEDLAKAHQVKVDRGGLPGPAQRLLSIAEAVPEKQGAR